MRIYIPSLGRADDRVGRGPAVHLRHDLDVWWVCSPQEAAAYRLQIMKHGVAGSVMECPWQGDGVHTLPDLRLWMAQDAAKNGIDKVIMLDDDINFLVRRGVDTWQLTAADKDDAYLMLRWVSEQLDEHETVGISAREGNNRAGVGDMRSLVMHNTRMMRVLAYRTETLLRLEHARMNDLEDFDLTLQILRSGGSNVVSYWWANGQRKTGEDGGCSLYRTHETHDAACRRLAELHPGLVRLREKHNKSGGEFGHRTEVTIMWKSAWREGQKLVKG